MKNHTELEPKPKLLRNICKAIMWPVIRTIRCPQIVPPKAKDFIEVLEQRRSNREMVRAPLREIVNVIGFTAAPRHLKVDFASELSRRPSPSAGALHCIEVLIAEVGMRPRIFRYDPWQHELQQLTANPGRLASFKLAVSDVLPRANGVAVIFAGDIEKIGSAYDNPVSLLWRDAGALIQTVYLVGTAQGLAVCSLGILGGEAIEAIGLSNQLTSCGVMMLGRNYQGP